MSVFTKVGPAVWCACAAALCAGFIARAAAPDLPHLQTDEATELSFLIAQGSADALATASLLAHLVETSDDAGAAKSSSPDPQQLIARAVALAPQRPELVWLQLRDCETRRCADEGKIAARLQTLDPQNSLAWLGDLNAAELKSPEAVTQVVEQMGRASTPRVYWNRLTVMMFDALTHPDKSPPTAVTQHADDRLMHVAGILSAVDVPALRPLAFACRFEKFELPGRQDACLKAIGRMEASDAVVTQLFRLSVLESWVPAASPSGQALKRDRLQRRYLTVASNRLRKGSADSDAEMRVNAMRHLDTEQEVERAMLTAFHEPLERPDDWRSPGPEN